MFSLEWKKKILSPPLLVILLWFKILTYAVALEIFPLFQNNCICGQSFGIMPVVCGLNFLFFVFWIVLFVAGNILFVAGNVLFLAGDFLFVAGNVLCQNWNHGCGSWLAASSSVFEKLSGRQPLKRLSLFSLFSFSWSTWYTIDYIDLHNPNHYVWTPTSELAVFIIRVIPIQIFMIRKGFGLIILIITSIIKIIMIILMITY